MKFKVGDYVTIRQWDDMEKQFGKDWVGSIKCGADAFTEHMKEFCGKRMKIKAAYARNCKYSLEGGDEWNFTDEMFEESKNPNAAKQEIHITVDGLKTIAVLKSGGKVITRAEAKCNPADTFNFETGAKLAIERLFGRKEKKDDEVFIRIIRPSFSFDKKGLVLKAHKHKGDGNRVYVYNKDLPNGGSTIVSQNYEWCYSLGIDCEIVEKTDTEKPKFVPHLEILGKYEGNIGEPTKFKDVVGRPLYIGDTVIHFDEDGEEYPETVICKDEDGAYVFGIKTACDGETGKIKEGWKVIKKRGYDEVADGEIIYDDVKYVKTEGKE